MKQISRGVTPNDVYIYKIYKVIRVLDGDTIEVLIELGFDTIKKEKIRLLGFDSPETFRPKTEAERIGGEKVKEYLINILKRSGKLFIRTIKDKKGKYGRYLGIIYEDIGSIELVSINEDIINFMNENNLTKEELRKK